jgi:Ankyrin repeat
MATIFEVIDSGDAGAIRAFLADHPDAVHEHDEQGLSVVMRAAYRGLLDVVLEHDPPLGPFDRVVAGKSDGLPGPSDWTPDGFTGLHLAAFVNNTDAARNLLDAGADPNALATASFARVTPLGTCSFAGAVDVARVLLERGADPRIGEDGSYTVEAEAIARGNEELAALIRHYAGDG